MKKFLFPVFAFVLIAAIGCTGKGPGKKDLNSAAATVPDTGFTGIKKMMSGQYVVMEVTFKNGVRDGLMKSFYLTGQVRNTYWYENGLKEDSVRFYYQEGQLFRTTPYKHDTVDGIQKQFYRTGKIRAKIGFSKGMRTPFFQEYKNDGKIVGGYPSIVVNIKDEYNTRGSYRIGLELSDKSKKVKFYRGDFTDGRFDTTKCKLINTVEGKATLNLNKSGTTGQGSVNVIAEIVTSMGNRYLTGKKIDLPYNDLK
jgi:hypothetical protein